MSASPLSRPAAAAARSSSFCGPSSFASTSTCPFPSPPLATPWSTAPSAYARRSFSSSESVRSARKPDRPAGPKTASTTMPTLVFKSKPNSYYPQNQFQVDVNKAKGGIERQTHKHAFLGATFKTSASDPQHIPPKGRLQEILFAGRSNTGKSTLINALVGSASLVKTSSKSGHTKMLNFFEIPNQMIIVDAPGYGERGRPEWGDTFQYFLTHRPPSPPSLLILLFTLGHPLSASDNLFLASLPPSIALLPVFTKTDLCPLHEIADRKRTLDNAIKAARDSAFVAAEERERLRNLAKMSAEFDASQAEEERAKVDAGLQGGWKSDLGAPQGPERPLVKAKTWDGMCVSTKKGWVLRDKTVDALRATILTQLQSTLLTDSAHRESHARAIALRRKAILAAADGDRRESSRMLNEIEDENKSAMEAFFAGLPGGGAGNASAGEADEDEDAEEEEEEAKMRAAQRHAPARGEFGLRAEEDKKKEAEPKIGGAFGRTKTSRGGSGRNWARK